ncbi:MAG: ATP phosphoribosyltransferase regulatory subunit [Gammaproteobacteria bacterium]|nr:ATP phosphoribosyltransferase regulatory subunit [Gammaproteobacteria bacterium]MDH5800721.1 ATP phosphoribosyltransferase regulatory subunit [Gammaproteobacteria bacterium]
MKDDRWILPEGIEELLPEDARRLELLRRQLLDLMHNWGYDIVMPPFVEYIESLLTSMGTELDLQTFKLLDQKTGRTMGIRADMTTQVARIDAHRLRRNEPTRLCYMGTVLRARSDEFASSRSLIQIGAELYGHAGVESDAEMLCLMLEVLAFAGIQSYVDIGHVGIFQGLATQAALDKEQKDFLFNALQRKAVPEIDAYLHQLSLQQDHRDMLAALAWLNGGTEVFELARQKLSAATAEVKQAISEMEQVAQLVSARHPQIPLHYDFAEVRGIKYHTGVVFAAYHPDLGQALAQGGRYDDIGKTFGRARPATGFSADLRTLMRLGSSEPSTKNAIFAPAGSDPALLKKIADLRASGQRVVQQLPGQTGGAKELQCDQVLELIEGEWVLR